MRQCSPGCATIKLLNDVCDRKCNNVNCAFDGGDCLPEKEKIKYKGPNRRDFDMSKTKRNG